MTITYVTITYNAASVLQRTLDSVLQQDYPDIVHLIIDGASTDGTLEMVNDYIERSNAADNGHRIQVTSEPDKGIYDAMNKGFAMATGDIIGILNSDDFYFDEHVLEDINRAMEDQPVDCIYGDLKFVQADNKDKVVRIWKGSQHKKGAFLRGWHPAHPTFYARREFFTHLGAFNTSFAVSADYELMLRFIEVAGLRNRYINRYFINMRMGGESTGSIRNIIRGNNSILRALRKYGYHPSPLFILYRMLPKIWATILGKLGLTKN